jgi:hypothetical protein
MADPPVAEVLEGYGTLKRLAGAASRVAPGQLDVEAKA